MSVAASLMILATAVAQSTDPVSFELRNGRIMLPVLLNDDGPYHFAYDTTTIHGLLDKDIAAPDALPAAVPIERIAIGGVALAPALFRTTDELPASEIVDGLLPASWIPHAVTFNFASATFTIAPSSGTPATTDGYTVPFRVDEDNTMRMLVEVNGGEACEAILDTRLATVMVVPRALAARRNWLTSDTPRLEVVPFGGDNEAIGQTQIRLDHVTAGRARVDSPICILVEGDDAPRIGTGFIRRFGATIDTQARYIRLVPESPVSPADGPIVGVGITPVQADAEGYWQVHVARGSPADRAGIRPGDRIADINRRPLKGAALKTVHDLLAVPEGDRISVGIRRDGAVEHILMTARRLL